MLNIRDFFNKQDWIFAKTYAKTAPHEYCLKEKVVGSKDDFVEAVKIIQKYGFTAYYFGYKNKYIHIDGHLYWVMHPIAEEVILINRSNIDDYKLSICPNLKKEV